MKSKRRDDIYNPQSKRYDRVKHSRKLVWEAKAQLDKGEITEKQYRLLIKKAQLVLTGQWQHKDSDFAPRLNRVEFVQEYDKDKKKSVLSTDLNKTQLPLGEREKQANKRAINKLAVQLFRRDYPDSSVRLVDCDLSVIKEYKRRARYIIKNTNGVKRVESHNPNRVKPLKLRPDYPNKVSVRLENKKAEVVPIPDEVTTPITLPETNPEASIAYHAEIAGCTVDLSSLGDSVLPQAVYAEASRLLRADYPRRKLEKQKLAVKLDYISRAIEALQ